MKEPWEQERDQHTQQEWAHNLGNDIRRQAADWRGARRNRHSGGQGLFVGALIVGVGVLLMLDNMGIIRAHDFWQFWPVVLIALGLSRMLESRRPAGMVWGGTIAAIGALLLLDKLHLVFFNFGMFWPLIIIGFGVTMLMRSSEKTRILEGTSVKGGSQDPDAHMWAFFGGGRRRINSPNFRSAEVFAVFGGFHIDLLGAQIPSGRAVLDINAIFGGVEVRVPDNWRVTVHGQGIFGAFEDKTLPPRITEGVPSPELVVTGSSIFGGATVRN